MTGEILTFSTSSTQISKAKTVSENLKMNSALLSRFDLVFILLDKPDKEMDKFISDHIMKVHGNKLRNKKPGSKRWGIKKEERRFIPSHIPLLPISPRLWWRKRGNLKSWIWENFAWTAQDESWR